MNQPLNRIRSGRIRHVALACGWLLLVFVLTGCAGYKLGPTGGVPAGARSIQVCPFQNNTREPRLLEAVTSALRKSLQQDGTYRLNTSGEGDIVVSGVITTFDRSGISFQPNDILTARDYALSMRARITVRERGTGKVLLDREVVGQTTLRVGNDFASAEREAIPMLAADLAQKTTGLLVDGTW